MSRVRGRSFSSSADSDGTPEKMITGTSAGVDTTTSRPEPRRSLRSTTAAADPLTPQRLEGVLGGVGGDDREAVDLEELHQRTPDRHIIFDDKDEAR